MRIKLCLWTCTVCGHVPAVDIYHIWTYTIYGHVPSVDMHHIRTYTIYGHVLSVDMYHDDYHQCQWFSGSVVRVSDWYSEDLCSNPCKFCLPLPLPPTLPLLPSLPLPPSFPLPPSSPPSLPLPLIVPMIRQSLSIFL